jgi:hypothetical protein
MALVLNTGMYRITAFSWTAYSKVQRAVHFISEELCEIFLGVITCLILWCFTLPGASIKGHTRDFQYFGSYSLSWPFALFYWNVLLLRCIKILVIISVNSASRVQLCPQHFKLPHCVFDLTPYKWRYIQDKYSDSLIPQLTQNLTLKYFGLMITHILNHTSERSRCNIKFQGYSCGVS